MSVYGSAALLGDTYHAGQEPSSNAAYTARVTHLLGVGTEQMNRALGRDYFRYPAAIEDPDVVWTAHGTGTPVLHQHGGIVSLTKLEVRYSAGGAYEEVDPAGYVLRGTDPHDETPEPDGIPWFHIVLTGLAVPTVFPGGIAAVRLTGVRGWDSPPLDLVEGNLERVRQLLTADPSWSGAPVGSDYGVMQPTLPRLPDSFYRFMDAEARRFRACHL